MSPRGVSPRLKRPAGKVERLYHSHIVGEWYEIDSYSDGMYGWIRAEHEQTGECRDFSWSVMSECDSQHAARDVALSTLGHEGSR